MCRDFHFIHISITLITLLCSIRAQAIAPVYCYQCSGLTCEPLPRYLETCGNALYRSKARCYSVAWNNTNIYRGCYEPEDDFVQHCKDRILEDCVVCDGNGCNNQSLFSDQYISCKNCPRGECTEWSLPRQDYRLCPKFLMTQAPSCYHIVSYEMNLYTFGCTNEMSVEDYWYCKLDVFKFMCRICYTHNCNDFLIDFEAEGSRLVCHSLIASNGIFCDRYTYLTPFTNCVADINFLRPRIGKMGGCTNLMIEAESSYTITQANFFHCGKSWCNNLDEIRGAISKGRYRPCLDTIEERNNITFGALIDSCCITGSYRDEKDKQISFSGCETKYPCKNSNYCQRCCDDDTSYFLERKPTCNAQEWVKKRTHKCYRCVNCLEVANNTQANQTWCSAPPGEILRCFLYWNATTVYRGCYQKKASVHDMMLNVCLKDIKNCRPCRGNLCNVFELRYQCYQCTGKNQNCRNNLNILQLTNCPGSARDYLIDTINNTQQWEQQLVQNCYSKLNAIDGLVTRGCIYPLNVSCELSDNCIRCMGPACNIYRWARLEHASHYRCIECDGPDNSTCALQPDEFEPYPNCPVEDLGPQCYAFFDSVHGTVHRGCARTEKEVYHSLYAKRCQIEPNSICATCVGDSCNYFTRKKIGGGAGVSLAVLRLIFIATFLNIFPPFSPL